MSEMPSNPSFEHKPNEELITKAESFLRQVPGTSDQKRKYEKVLQAIRNGQYDTPIEHAVENKDFDTGEVDTEEYEESPREWLEGYIEQLKNDQESFGDENHHLQKIIDQAQELVDSM